jgi:hypothetical protein
VRGGGSSSGFLILLVLGFLAWWWWPSIEPVLPPFIDRARVVALGLLGQAEAAEQLPGPTVVVATKPGPTPTPPPPTPTPEPLAARFPFCAPGQEPAFVFGFAALKQQLGPTMGEPLECEHANLDNGDTLQATTTGLAVYEPSTNTPRFTNGWRSWALTPGGLLSWDGPDAPPELSPGRERVVR